MCIRHYSIKINISYRTFCKVSTGNILCVSKTDIFDMPIKNNELNKERICFALNVVPG